MLTFSKYLAEGSSMVRRTIGAKRAAFAGSSAMTIAKNKNPALYRKYNFHNKKRKEIKAKIQHMYAAQARSNARRKIR